MSGSRFKEPASSGIGRRFPRDVSRADSSSPELASFLSNYANLAVTLIVFGDTEGKRLTLRSRRR